MSDELPRYACVIIEGSDDVEFVRDYQGEWVRFDDVYEQAKVIRKLEAENAKLREICEDGLMATGSLQERLAWRDKVRELLKGGEA